jgi:hypothetical protein
VSSLSLQLSNFLTNTTFVYRCPMYIPGSLTYRSTRPPTGRPASFRPRMYSPLLS